MLPASGGSFDGGGMERERRYSPFATFVRRRRLDLRLTQEQLARRCGEDFSGSYIAKLERDAVETPPPARVRRLAHALEVPSSELGVLIYHDEDEPLPALPPAPEPTLFDDPTIPTEVKVLLRPHAATTDAAELRAFARVLTAGLDALHREAKDQQRRFGGTADRREGA